MAKSWKRSVIVTLILTSLMAMPAAAEECLCDYDNSAVMCSRMNFTDFSDRNMMCGLNFWKIDLSGNVLRSFPSDVDQFRIINVSSNALQKLDVEVSHKVEDLDVSSNGLKEIKLSNAFSSLRRLYASKNRLGIGNNDILRGECNLVYLDVSKNEISSLKSAIKCAQLSILLANRNMISKVPNDLSVLTKLEVLCLSFNKLSNLSKLPRTLKVLDLSGNNLKRISVTMLSGLKFLTDLNLSGNEINDIDESAFASLGSLKSLLLRKNKLKGLNNESFYGLKSLKMLGVDHNEISFISDDTFIHLHYLEQLYLDNNLLTTLPPLQLGGHVFAVSILFNFIEKMDLAALLVMASGSKVRRAVSFPLNPIRGDDPEWPMIMRFFKWECVPELLPRLEKIRLEEKMSPPYVEHKVVHSECPCALFVNEDFSFGTCISDAGVVDGIPWYAAAKKKKLGALNIVDDSAYPRDAHEL